MEEKLKEAMRLISFFLHHSKAPYIGYADIDCVNYWEWEQQASKWLISTRKLLGISVNMDPTKCQQEIWNSRAKQLHQCSYKHVNGKYCKVHTAKNKEAE